MRSRALLIVLAVAIVALTIVDAGRGAGASTNAGDRIVAAGCASHPGHPLWAGCNELLLADRGGRPLTSATTLGYRPGDLRSAYGLTEISREDGTGQTVAVIEAYNDPSAEADMAVYRAHFHLHPCASGCFSVVNQSGQSAPLPTKNNQGWASEQSLDLDMVSAICPLCKVLVVEADDQSDADLGTADDTAAKLGADAISNSFGSTEAAADLKFNTLYFDHPGIAVTAGSGDSGYGVEYPAASPDVTAVGGTMLEKSSDARGWTETSWSGGGSGCSSEEAKPTWQTDTGCANRTVADVSIDADPYSGVAVYDSDCSLTNFLKGICFPDWGLAGGTSVGAPVVAAMYGLAGHSTAVDGANTAYAHPSDFNDVTSGSNGTCTPVYLCTAGPGYDGPTGVGSPAGIGGF